MFGTTVKAAAIALMTLVGSAASAITVSYTFPTGSNGSSSVTQTVGGIALTVTAQSLNGATVSSQNINRQSASGWGVHQNPDSGRIGADTTKTERLLLSFGSTVVNLDSISYFLQDSGSSLILRNLSPASSVSLTGTASGVISKSLTGMTGSLFALDGVEAGNGGYLNGLTVSTVPLPAGAVLLLTGLGAFVVLRRRAAAV